MGPLLNLAEPTPAQQQEFQAFVGSAVDAGRVAVNADPTEASNWQSLATVYVLLTQIGVTDAIPAAEEALTEAKRYDPLNPEIRLQEAQVKQAAGDIETAKELVREAISLRPNYTEAYFYLTQLDIATGDVDSAIASAQQTIALEPNNPARYYQLGVLFTANNDVDSAVAAFEQSVALDPNFANALYFLALGYDQQGRSGEARTQLEKVLELNPDNTDVQTLLSRLENGESLSATIPTGASLPTEAPEVEGDSNVISEDETDLLAPVNPTPEETEEEIELDEADAEIVESATEVFDGTEGEEVGAAADDVADTDTATE